MSEGARIELEGAVLTITIDRPQRGNALDSDTVQALIARFDALSTDPGDARAVVVQADGKHFCTGADISSGGRGDKPRTGHMVRSLSNGAHRLVQRIWDCSLPTVAAVQGRASGLGLHVALACDQVVASTDATFMEPFGDRGFSADSGGTWLLPRLIGISRAKQMLFQGTVVDAPTALQWGLIAAVVDTDLHGAAGATAAELARRPTIALAAMKRLVHDNLGTDLAGAMHAETMAVELTLRSDDFKEGMKAFLDKRPPDFQGR